jgi:seryl-tRNA synthetase
MIRSNAAEVVRELRARGDYWEPAPGVPAMRGALLELRKAIEPEIEAVACAEEPEVWSAPAALTFEVLARSDYFASFPRWLTAASHLGGEDAALEAVAGSDDPVQAARDALAPAAAMLPPRLCHHVFAALAGRTLADPAHVTLQGTCWRHDEKHARPLEREWAFTAREAVLVGRPSDVEGFLDRSIERAVELATALGLECAVVRATDPFFAPTARGRKLLQEIKGLKRELLLPLGNGRMVAAASFNHHETFFGRAFGIRTYDDAPAATGCAAFGIERWLLAYMVAHGPDPEDWPDLQSTLLLEVP